MKQNSLHCQPKLFRIRLSQNSSKWPQICIVSYPCKNGQFHDSCQKSTIPIPLLLRLRQGHSTLLLPELLLALLFFCHQTAVARKNAVPDPTSGTLEVLEVAEVSESFLILVGLGGFWVWRASRHFWKFCPNNSKKGYFPSKPLVVLAGNQVPVTAGAMRKKHVAGTTRCGVPGFFRQVPGHIT